MTPNRNLSTQDAWPALPLTEWKNTSETLHMWTQIVGKVRLALSPYVNHWWEVPLREFRRREYRDPPGERRR